MTTRNFRVNNGLEVGDIVISASANTITGGTTSAPSADGQFANKKYVDDSLAGLSQNSISQLNTNVTVTDSGTGKVEITADATEVADFAVAATTITATGAINLTAGTDVVVPANVGVTFGTGEKIEGDSTDLTVTSGALINLTATTDVAIPANVGVTFGTHEKIESDDTDLTITVGSGGDINIGQDIGMTFGNDGEKIEGNGTKLTIASSDAIDLTATTDVVIPADVGLTFGTGEKIEGDNTDLTITSGAKINLTATSDVHIPNDVGIAFGAGGEKIESDGTDLTVTSTGLCTITATGNTVITNNALISGNLVLTGNLTVNGSTTTVSSTNTTIADNMIELNTGISASSNDAGFIIERGSTGNNAAIIWDESADKFAMGLTTSTAADKSGGITVSVGTLLANLEGTATAAEYSDVAERFASDSVYAPGTVVALGGAEEITQVNEEASDEVFGVVSSLDQAAFKMNGGAGNDNTHPYIAMTGRVNVKVIGTVNKGDRLISASVPGYARAATKAECTAFNVIGRALTSKSEAGQGSVLAAVRTSH